MKGAAAIRMIDATTPVATIVLDHSECGPVLARHQIDYCCKGRRPLAEACRDAGIALDRVSAELETAIRRRAEQSAPTADLRWLTTRDLILRVIAPHHQYLHRTLPFLEALATKVARVHGDRDPTLRVISELVAELSATLRDHLREEEHGLFPALLEGRAADAEPQLRTMRDEHAAVGELLASLRTAALDYVVPDWACTSYRTLMRELAALEADTLTHVHVENHVLLPRYLP